MRRNKLPIFQSAPLVLSAKTVIPTLIILSAITIPVAMLIVNIASNTANTASNQITPSTPSIPSTPSRTPTPSSTPSSTPTPSSPSSTPTPTSSRNVFEKSEPINNFSSYINKLVNY